MRFCAVLAVVLIGLTPAQASEVYGIMRDITGETGMRSPVTITPITFPSIDGNFTITGPSRTIRPKANGNWTNTLVAGDYTISQAGYSFTIAVPDDTTNNVVDIASSGLTTYTYTNLSQSLWNVVAGTNTYVTTNTSGANVTYTVGSTLTNISENAFGINITNVNTLTVTNVTVRGTVSGLAGDGSGLTNVLSSGVLLNPLSVSPNTHREAIGGGAEYAPAQVETLSLAGATNAHGTLVWYDSASENHYLFVSTRQDSPQLWKVNCDDFTDTNSIVFPSTYSIFDEFVEIDDVLYGLLHEGVGVDDAALYSINASTLATNKIAESPTFLVGSAGTILTDGQSLYIGGRSNTTDVYFYKFQTDGTPVYTNQISTNGVPFTVSDDVHSGLYDGEYFYVTDNGAYGTGDESEAHIATVDPSDGSIVAVGNITNSFGNFSKATDDMSEWGDWLFIGPDGYQTGSSTTDTNLQILAVSKDYGSHKWIDPRIYNAPCYGVFRIGEAIYCTYSDGTIVRIDPATWTASRHTMGGSYPTLTNVNELVTDGKNLFATIFEGPVVVHRMPIELPPPDLVWTAGTTGRDGIVFKEGKTISRGTFYAKRTNYVEYTSPRFWGTAATLGTTAGQEDYDRVKLDGAAEASTNWVVLERVLDDVWPGSTGGSYEDIEIIEVWAYHHGTDSINKEVTLHFERGNSGGNSDHSAITYGSGVTNTYTVFSFTGGYTYDHIDGSAVSLDDANWENLVSGRSGAASPLWSYLKVARDGTDSATADVTIIRVVLRYTYVPGLDE